MVAMVYAQSKVQWFRVQFSWRHECRIWSAQQVPANAAGTEMPWPVSRSVWWTCNKDTRPSKRRVGWASTLLWHLCIYLPCCQGQQLGIFTMMKMEPICSIRLGRRECCSQPVLQYRRLQPPCFDRHSLTSCNFGKAAICKSGFTSSDGNVALAKTNE